MRASSIALIIVVFAVGSASAQSKDDKAVFDTTLARFAAEFEQSQHTAPEFLVFNETAVVLAQDVGFARKDLPKQLVDALLLQNSAAQPIGNYVPPSPFRQSSAEALGRILETGKPGLPRPHYYNWELLRAQFPKAAGTLELASPAYSPDGSAALVYFWTGCGTQCASGYLYMLERRNGTWKVVRTFSPWTS